MSQNNFRLTYGQLKDRATQILTARGISRQQIRNFATALNGWMRRLGLNDTAVIGDELGTGFDSRFQAHQDYLRGQVTERTMRDQCEHLQTWRKHYDECCRIDTLPPTFHGAFNALVEAGGISIASLARASGISKGTISTWLARESMPATYSAPGIALIEQALDVPNGTLLNRLPGRKSCRYDKQHKMTSSPVRSTWGEKMSKRRKEIGAYAMQVDGLLETQWLDLIDYKTDPYRKGSTYANTWRIKKHSDTGGRVIKAMETRHGMVCVSAGITWSRVASYLGFLCLPSPGKGLEREDAKTLAWLIHFPFIMDHVRWLRNLADGKVHNGITAVLKNIKSLARPDSGFLWSRPDLAHTLPNPAMVLGADFPSLDPERQAARWQQHCASIHAKCVEMLQSMEGARQKVSKSRDPREPIAHILASPTPLKELLRVVRAVEVTRLTKTYGRTYICWLRDLVLLKMLVSNPLRISQFAVMRYRPDNRGNLYQTPDGNWRLRFQASDFKNEKGAAFEAYDVAVEPSVSPWIARYLAEARPYCVGADICDYFFLPYVQGPNTKQAGRKGGMWTAGSISDRIKRITHQYFPDTPGFCAHAFRHIIATDHLKRNAGDYVTVAKLLHDKLETVLKEYSHVTVEHGLSVLHQGIKELSAELV